MPKSHTFTTSISLPFVVFAGDENEVLRLHVAMDDAARVGVREAGAHLHHDRRDALRGELLLLLHQRTELDAVEELHCKIQRSVGLLTEVEHARDVRMVEPARGERLGIEPTAKVDVALEGLVEELHRDRHHQLTMAGLVHGAHAAATDQLLHDELAARQRAANLGILAFFRR